MKGKNIYYERDPHRVLEMQTKFNDIIKPLKDILNVAINMYVSNLCIMRLINYYRFFRVHI